MWFLFVILFFFFKQKTAYEMRISDWSSDVCSSDLFNDRTGPNAAIKLMTDGILLAESQRDPMLYLLLAGTLAPPFIGTTIFFHQDRKSVVSGKSVSVSVDLGGRRIINKKKNSRQARY